MIITCPSCSARFAVKAEAIGVAGRKVKCTKCQESWFQEPDAEALEAAKHVTPEPEHIEPVKEGANVPVIKKESRNILLKMAFAASFLVFIASLVVVLAGGWFFSTSKYVAISDVVIEKIASDGKTDLLVKGKIVNKSEGIKKMPDLEINVYDEKRSKLQTIIIEAGGSEMAAGIEKEFESKIDQLSEKAVYISLDIGSRYDHIWR